jgi:hypothetical protein
VQVGLDAAAEALAAGAGGGLPAELADERGDHLAAGGGGLLLPEALRLGRWKEAWGVAGGPVGQVVGGGDVGHALVGGEPDG